MATGHPTDLFERAADADTTFTPLAERMRPRTLAEVVGQEHLLAEGRILREAIERDRIPSMILWGPPGTGKTTLARVIAAHTGAAFETLSAVSAGIKDVRAVVAAASDRRKYERRATVLFIDEIHRFNKAQQDGLLPHVERGAIRLIGATTENPSFEVNSALLSRTRVFQLRELERSEIVGLLQRALADADRGLGDLGLAVADEVLDAIAGVVDGDARKALTALELAADLVAQREGSANRVVDLDLAAQALGRRDLKYDRAGEEHYNVISAFIKSMRASDADAAVYYLARMLEAGEDPMFIARRIVIFASEDVGNADPQALVVANAAQRATHALGMPEAMFPLCQATLYLALASKSNATLRAYSAAHADVREHGALPVPLEIRNAVTPLMKAVKYGEGYRYPHDHGGVDTEHTSHLPAALAEREDGPPRYVDPGPLGWEARAWQRLMQARGKD